MVTTPTIASTRTELPSVTPLQPAAVRRALALHDLTDPDQGPHALQTLLDEAEQALARPWGIPVRRHRASAVVPISHNYDRLRYSADAAARDARYTRYLDDERMLRSHTSAMLPALLDELAAAPPEDQLLSCPGITYRRDVIDRQHCGEPHQLDLWRIRGTGPALRNDALLEMVEHVVGAVLPGRRWRVQMTTHPYTVDGWEIEVADGDRWVEVGECGIAHPEVLAAAGLPAAASGLAMGLGLDRLLMLRKGIDDIRLLRSADERVARQMRDLTPYKPVSTMPPSRRDLSLAVDAAVDGPLLADGVREALGNDARLVEEVVVLAETAAEDLPPSARTRLGLVAGQKNVLVRLILRDLERTLDTSTANTLRDRVAAALHQGTAPPPESPGRDEGMAKRAGAA